MKLGKDQNRILESLKGSKILLLQFLVIEVSVRIY